MSLKYLAVGSARSSISLSLHRVLFHCHMPNIAEPPCLQSSMCPRSNMVTQCLMVLTVPCKFCEFITSPFLLAPTMYQVQIKELGTHNV